MRLSLGPRSLGAYVARQLGGLFPDRRLAGPELARGVRLALERAEHCFARARLKSFVDERGGPVFDHLHTDQYAMFLYFLASSLHRLGADPALAAKVYALNKALHALDVFYEVELPDVFAFQHPVGTVLGRAHYADYLLAYQRCSVGSSLSGARPRLGRGVVLFPGSAVIGDCTVGDNCWLSAGTLVMDAAVPGGSVVFGQSPSLVVRPTRRDVRRDLFGGGG